MHCSAAYIVAIVITLCLTINADKNVNINDVNADNLMIRTNNKEDLVTSVINECSSLTCVKDKFLSYLDSLLGFDEDESRNYQNENLDEQIFNRMARLLTARKYSFNFGGILFSYNPKSGIDLDLPAENDEDQATSQARGLLKKKLLLPILLLLKLKLKALTPIILLATALKSFKALVMSKLALLGVIGFLVYELVLKKGGMKPPAMMTVESTTPDSYDPTWNQDNGGPYSRVWTSGSNSNSGDSSHNLAYSAYYPVHSGISTRSPP